jgi:raffinose/stachyose/melibiose transport system substrate-binding protein
MFFKRGGIQMKAKRVMALGLAAMMAVGMAGCGSSASTSSTASTASEAGSTAATTTSGKGKVYMLNFKPETDQAWQDLAKTYTDQTGVEVNILTAADGQYATTLQSEMAKSEAPTIFTVGNTTAAQTWDDYTTDLSKSELYNHLTDKSLTINYNGKVAGVANCFEAYGIIYNKTILEAYGKLDNAVVKSADEITSLDTLEKVADDIQNRIDEVNQQLADDGSEFEITEAFASSGLDDGSSWRFSGHLANMPLYYEFKADGLEDLTAGEATIKGTYLDNFKRVWDMYTRDSAADPKTLNSGALNAESEFGMGEAVFYQNGDWEFSALTNEENGYLVTADDMGMMPIYFGVDDENQGLCVGTENYWAVNSQASADDQQASLDFLNWVITSDDGRDAVTNTMGLTAPFDTFTGDYATKNVFANTANELAADGKTAVAWSFNATPNVDDWRADVVSALTAYTDGSGNWDAVKTAFVDGWATQWTLAQEASAQS